MRFFENGPVISDKLLQARDQGRVVFFCGAGVSRAYANLDDFFGLANKVAKALGVTEGSPSLRILEASPIVEQLTGLPGLISADKVFGLLEAQFPVEAIERAVAQSLRPASDAELTGHRILLDLAKTETGKIQLVTTNFDRLFDACLPGKGTWLPRRFPDVTRAGELDGVVYLHGKANAAYNGSEGDGFVLSSSSFGRAYLADGWATEFVKSILERYIVVFVGYAADDPPIHYLLEALKASGGKIEGIYAFQAGTTEEAAGRWDQRGVEAIAYDAVDQHRALWQTLEAWAERARGPAKWTKAVIKKAMAGPEALLPYERGQFMHVLTTQHGAKLVSEMEVPPPGDWFSVLDPYLRFGAPAYTGDYSNRGTFIDPFDRYGLDSDLAPASVNPDDRNRRKREVPAGTWDGFALNAYDRSNLEIDQMTSFRGHWAANVPRLPVRLYYIGVWLAKVSGQAAAVWWAAHQNGLHPSIRELISRYLNHAPGQGTPVTRAAWHYLFEAWQSPKHERHIDWFQLEDRIERDGWNATVVRQYGLCGRPYIKAEPVWNKPVAPRDNTETVRSLVLLDVGYPDRGQSVEVPNEWLPAILKEGRRNIEVAELLEAEITGSFHLDRITPINPSDDPDVDGYDRSHGFSALVLNQAQQTKRLSEVNPKSARAEVAAWADLNGRAYERLRVWAAGDTVLTTVKQARQFVNGLDDDAFWDMHQERDLLFSLAGRWADLGTSAQRGLENRIVCGPARWETEEDNNFEQRKAWHILNRLHWLAGQGCAFNLDLNALTKKLQTYIPEWTPSASNNAAQSTETRIGWVQRNTDYAELLAVSPDQILPVAEALGQRGSIFDVERKPFSGLSAERPDLAFSALRQAASLGEYPEWAWREFLQHEQRAKDKASLMRQIGRTIRNFPANSSLALLPITCDWISRTAFSLSRADANLFDELMSGQIALLSQSPQAQTSNIIRGDKKPDWMMEAINATAGRLAETSFRDPRVAKISKGEAIPQAWLITVTRLLDLKGDAGRFALVIYARNLNWFYYVAPEWTEQNILSKLTSAEDLDRDAFWSGFLFSSELPTAALFRRLKTQFLLLPLREDVESRDQGSRIAAFFLSGWSELDEKTNERLVSESEFRIALATADDDFRSHVLWTVERWTADKNPKIAAKWSRLQIQLLKDVWPRHKSARSPRVSSRLLEIVFANAKNFQELAEAVLPLLSPIDQDHITIPALYRQKNNFATRYPAETLALLTAALPENPHAWPYGIEATLTRVQAANNDLASDPRLLELLRRWDGR